jgi:hypothetical protein
MTCDGYRNGWKRRLKEREPNKLGLVIEYEAPTIKFQTLVEHPHLLEIYYYISYHTFSKEENASSQCTGSDSF